MIETRRVRARLDKLVAPDASEWDKADEATIPVEPTPLDRQPSAYVQEAWRDRPRGDLRELKVRALTSAKGLALRLEWPAARASRLISDVNAYPDGCAVLFGADGKHFELATMGTPKHPVRGWHWRAGEEEPFVIDATGLGTVSRVDAHDVAVRARWTSGHWQVVFARPFQADGVPLAPGKTIGMGVAVWSGSAGERAGLKSHSPEPHKLRIGD